MPVGFLPCFSQYRHSEFPLDDFYKNKTFVNKISVILHEILTCVNPVAELLTRTGCKTIMQITPDSAEGKRIINMCAWSNGKLYRLDFGKNKMRVIIGLEDNGEKRLCYFFGLDAEHKTFPIGKTRR